MEYALSLLPSLFVQQYARSDPDLSYLLLPPIDLTLFGFRILWHHHHQPWFVRHDHHLGSGRVGLIHLNKHSFLVKVDHVDIGWEWTYS